MQDEVLEIVRQLLKGRLRHFLYATKADECGPSEQMWRSLLTWQCDLTAEAEKQYADLVAKSGRPSLDIVRQALVEAAADVRESVSAQREALEPLIDSYIASFDPYGLVEHPAEA